MKPISMMAQESWAFAIYGDSSPGLAFLVDFRAVSLDSAQASYLGHSSYCCDQITTYGKKEGRKGLFWLIT